MSGGRLLRERVMPCRIALEGRQRLISERTGANVDCEKKGSFAVAPSGLVFLLFGLPAAHAAG